MILNIDDNFYFDLDTSILFFDKQEYDMLNDFNKQFIKQSFLKKRNTVHNNDRTIKTINLIPSMHCDGKCLYCYNEDVNNTVHQDMSIVGLEENIKTIQSKYTIDLQTIRMYGGEPLKNKNLKDIISFFHKYNNDMIFYISSGLFISEELYQQQLEVLKTLSKTVNMSIGVGVDLGTYPETRICSYISKEQLLQRCDDLINNGINIIFVNTVTKHTNINNLFEGILNLKHKYNNVSNKPKFRIAIACDKIYAPSLKQLDEMYDMLKDIYFSINDNNITSNIYPYLDVIYAPSIYKLTESMFYFQYEPFYCGVFSDMITILSNNELRHCHMDTTDTAIDLKEYIYKDKLLNNEECLNCDYFMIC
jgi:MoaA/NifB/PqqE/SkfB family radical SAM enzyme